MSKIYFITAIGTNSGKTIVSAIFTQALNADYWKPIQAGDLDNTDSMKVAELISNKDSKINEERYKLSIPKSPHIAAKHDNIDIKLSDFSIPHFNNNLIIEGAGGILVPLNENLLIIDLIKLFNAEVVLVSDDYLGSINHTLLSIEFLKSNNIKIKGIVFNKSSNIEAQDYILKYSKLNCLLRINIEKELNKEVILQYSNELKINLK